VSAADAAEAVALHLHMTAPRATDLAALAASAEPVAARAGQLVGMTLLLTDAPRFAVRILCAGMPVPLAGGRSGVTAPLAPGRGVPLGLARDARRVEQGPFRLSPEQVLLVVSDGITDAPAADGTPFGPDRVARALAVARPAGPRAVARAVLDAADDWTTPGEESDRTAFALRFRREE
jgi:hypothetical protein